MKRYVGLILACAFVLTGCNGKTNQATDVALNIDSSSDVEENNTDTVTENEFADTSSSDVDTTENASSSEDLALGLSNMKIDKTESLSDGEKLILQYFDNDYITISDFEFMQRYPQVYEGSQITCTGTVKKILPSTNNEEYQLLIWIVKTDDEFCYRRTDLNDNSYQEYLEKNKNSFIVIKGKQTDMRLIEGDRITIYGRYETIDNYEIDGISYTIPTINAYRTKLGSSKTNFDEDNIKTIAKTIFGKDITVRNAVDDNDYNERDLRYGFIGDPFMIVEPDNQANAKFTNFRFYMCEGVIEDGKTEPRLSWNSTTISREIEFAPDFEHFYLFIHDTELKNLTVEYYDKNFQKIWSREFEETQNKVYDYTTANIYLVANNDLHIINTQSGEDRFEPIYVGEKTGIRKFTDYLIMTSESATDTIMKTDLSGKILWKTNLESNFYFSNMQIVEERIICGYGQKIYVLNKEDGEILITATSMESQYVTSPTASAQPEGMIETPAITTPDNISEILTSPETFGFDWNASISTVKQCMSGYTLDTDEMLMGDIPGMPVETYLCYTVPMNGQSYNVSFMFRDDTLSHINFSDY